MWPTYLLCSSGCGDTTRAHTVALHTILPVCPDVQLSSSGTTAGPSASSEEPHWDVCRTPISPLDLHSYFLSLLRSHLCWSLFSCLGSSLKCNSFFSAHSLFLLKALLLILSIKPMPKWCRSLLSYDSLAHSIWPCPAQAFFLLPQLAEVSSTGSKWVKCWYVTLSSTSPSEMCVIPAVSCYSLNKYI